MKRKRNLTILILLGIIIVFGVIRGVIVNKVPQIDARDALPHDYENGAWVWKKPGDMSSDEVTNMIAFAKASNIKTIYLYIEDYLYLSTDSNSKTRTDELNEFNEKVKFFVSLANQNGLQVDGLAGDVDWADPENKYMSQMLLDYIFAFNADPQNIGKFAGMQFDIEFYNRDDFKTAKERFSQDYLNLVAELAGKIKKQGGKNIRLGFAIPYWFYDENSRIPRIEYHAKYQDVLEHMLGILQNSNAYLAVMAYRNKTAGNNGIINISKANVALADNAGGTVKINIGIETEKNVDKTITFYGENQSDISAAADQIVEAFSSSKSFAGVSIHTLQSYMQAGTSSDTSR